MKINITYSLVHMAKFLQIYAFYVLKGIICLNFGVKNIAWCLWRL